MVSSYDDTRSSSEEESGIDTTLLDHSKEKIIQTTANSWSIRRKQTLVALVALGLAAAGFSIYGLTPAMGIGHKHDEFGDCGQTPSEAKAKGCIFDNISYVWIQPACHHPELFQTFWDRSNLSYYSSSEWMPETRIPEEEIMEGRWEMAWTVKEHHPVHCLFVLAKLHEAVLNHMPMDSKATGFGHTLHCSEVLMQPWLHEIEDCNQGKCERATVTMGYSSCGYY